MRRHPTSKPDLALWAAYTQDVRRLDGRPPVPPPSTPAPVSPAPAAPPPAARKPAHKSGPIVTGVQPAGLDRASWSRLRSGKLAPVRSLDLHGRTTQAAYHALEHFLAEARADQLRCVEIITGRGTGAGGGAIRRELPFWLNLPHLRPLVLATTHPHAQNPGATIVLLKRVRAVPPKNAG